MLNIVVLNSVFFKRIYCYRYDYIVFSAFPFGWDIYIVHPQNLQAGYLFIYLYRTRTCHKPLFGNKNRWLKCQNKSGNRCATVVGNAV